MKTLVTRSVHRAAALLRAGGLVGFPTETVYGLGANALDGRAVRRIFRAKGRPGDNPLIVHVADPAQIEQVVLRMSAAACDLMEAFFPGPLTLVLPRRPCVPDDVTAGLDTVGVRAPALPLARAFLAACGVPVAAPSANRSGGPSPTTWQAVREDLDGRIEAILQGPRAHHGLESTVVDCTGRAPRLLRAGAVTLEQLRSVVPSLRAAAADAGPARSPGLRHRHYAPQARVVWAGDETGRSSRPRAWIGLEAPPEPKAFARVRVCPSVEAYAHALFRFFRACDAEGIRTICCQAVPETGLGLALMDRMRRAVRR